MNTENTEGKKFNWKVFGLAVMVYCFVEICLGILIYAPLPELGQSETAHNLAIIAGLVAAYYFYQARKNKPIVIKDTLFIILCGVVLVFFMFCLPLSKERALPPHVVQTTPIATLSPSLPPTSESTQSNDAEPPIDELGGVSSDKKFTLFVRTYPDRRPIGYPYPDATTDNEIWIKDNTNDKEWLLVRSGEVPKYQQVNPKDFSFFSAISNLGSPVFSLDGKKVYFISSAWVTSGAIYSIDVTTGKLRFVTDGNTLKVITSGEYKGNLIVNKHRYYGPYDHDYIVTDTGTVLKDLDEDSAEATIENENQ